MLTVIPPQSDLHAKNNVLILGIQMAEFLGFFKKKIIFSILL